MVYLDHAATTPMLPEAVQAMTAQLTVTGNASSLHADGRRARRTVEEARESLAVSLGARPSEIVFTAGGTEADNLAVKGLYWARRAADPARTRVLASPVEHHAVLDAVEWLVDHEGARVEWLPVDPHGRVHAEALREAIARNPADVALATVMWANNEIGTIQPVRELAEAAAEFGIPLHADAVQAFGQLEVDFAASGLAAMTVSGHKIGGPYGIGALLLGREYAPVPVLHGGGQERQVRSGTLDTPAIAAFAAAGRYAVAHRDDFARDIGALRDDLVKAVLAAAPDAVLGGDPDPAGGCPPTPTSPSPAARATPCCSSWTPRASPAPRAPPAPPASPSPATSCWPPACPRSSPAAPCGSPWGTPRRHRTWPRWRRPSARSWNGHGARG